MVEARQSLQQLLAGLGEAARFESVGQVSAVLPGLEVKGIGSIGVPVAPADAKRMIGKASPAPYGRGEATIVDTEVRRVWQLEPARFVLRNAAWNEAVAGVVDAVKRDFGIRGKITAELYKLLVYEKGSFFKPHRDTEKIAGMFGTLVVCLPSRHEGGTLILEHDGQTKRIEFGGKDSEFETRYVAFYADCRHEVTPVKSGYRVCLVYNLASTSKKQAAAPHHAAAVAEAARLLTELFTAAEPLNKLAIPFMHQYTEASFGPKQLKGADRARADVLMRAAQSLDDECYFALLTLHQEGIPAYGSFDDGDSWGRGRSRWSSDDSDEGDEGDSGDDSGGEFEEIFEEELKLEHWRDAEGQEQSFGVIHFDDNEVLGLDDKAGWSYKQEVQEATGNEGASMERWYRHAVLVIWPRERHFDVLAAEGPASAPPALEKLVTESKTAIDLAVCGKVAKAIIDNWRGSDPYGLGIRSCSGPMLRVLERIGDEKLALCFVRDVFPTSFNGSEGRALHRLCQCLGWKTLAPAIQAFLAHQKPAEYRTQLNQIVTICEHLCCDPPALSKERRVACSMIADELMKVVKRWDKALPSRWDGGGLGTDGVGQVANDFDEDEDEGGFGEDEDESEDEDGHDAEPKRQSSEEEQEASALQQLGNKRLGIVANMVRLLAAIGAGEHLSDFLAHILADTRHYDLRAVVIPDVQALYAPTISTAVGRRAAARLLQHCLTELREATAQSPEPPKDWKRAAKLGCTCGDCAALSRFLRDPAERVGRFPMNKQRRQHLHRQIDHHGCDCTHVTERKSSPQTLVCTKTQHSYERRRQQFGVDQIVLAELEKLVAGKNEPSRRVRKRSYSAVQNKVNNSQA